MCSECFVAFHILKFLCRAYFCLYYKSLQIHGSLATFFANADRVPGNSAGVRFVVFQILLRTFYFCDDPPLLHDLFIVSAKSVNTFRNNDISGFQFP